MSSGPMTAERPGLRNSASGTRSSHPITAPVNSTAAIRVPTMYPTPMSIGDAWGLVISMPPAYWTRSPNISTEDSPNATKRLVLSCTN